ncbi:MAG: cell surface protein SprA [Saprospiraceae bacterium]|jgi:cell surface protein SprA
MTFNSHRYFFLFLFMVVCSLGVKAIGVGPEYNEYTPDLEYISIDTIPIQDRYTDFISTDYYNPFDITPSIIEQTVDYDFETGRYIVMEKIGDEFYRSPSYLTMDEYLDWQQKKQQEDHFRKLSGIKSPEFSSNLKFDPMADIDIDKFLADRLFGGTEISIKPTGNIDLIISGAYQKTDNPNISEEFQRQLIIPDFDMDINMGVDGKIGEKLNLGFNYNTQATFDFDQKLNLGYGSDIFDEDDIIKTIEAGNISFPLKSQLIQGSQDLFGLKTELQFGKFWLTALASQSRTERDEITIENGKLIQEFEIRPDEYDENRHFFVSQYNREIYESALQNIPQVRSLMNINNIEVWVTVKPNETLNNAAPVALIDFLGEPELNNFSDPNTQWVPQPVATDAMDLDGKRLPTNNVSELFNRLVNDRFTRESVNTVSALKSNYGMREVVDFEVRTMRKLNPNEYTYNPQLGFISLRQKLEPNQSLGIAYEYTYSINGDQVYKVGEMTNETVQTERDIDNNPKPQNVIYLKMLKSSNQTPNQPQWDLMMKNVYQLSSSQLTQEDFELDIFFEDNSNSSLKRYIPEAGYRNIPLLNLFDLDRLNNYGDPQEDGVFDFVPGVTVNTSTGSIIFPVLQPFGQSLLELLDGNADLYAKYGYPELYTNTVTSARQQLGKNRFLIKGQVKSNTSSEISLGAFGIPPGSVTVRAGSQILKEGIDYDIDYGIGRIKILNDAYLQQGVPIRVSFEDQGLFGLQQKTMIGLRGEFRFNENFTLGMTYMNLFERPFSQKVNIGNDPINNRMYGLDLSLTADAPGITKLVDKLPFISTNAPSSITVNAEVAALKPGSSSAINVPGEDQEVISIDDFEGATSGVLLGSRGNQWVMASTPTAALRNEGELINDVAYGANRALMNWGVVFDRRARTGQDQADSYSRRIDATELFPIRQQDRSQLPDLLTFDVHYYPTERGPYNFDVPDGITSNGRKVSQGVTFDQENEKIVLNRPETRWAGIQRSLQNNDFEAANYEYVEFWMMNPFMDRTDSDNTNDRGVIYIDLGNVSEDIMKDDLQFFENSIPGVDELVPTRSTVWGEVPLAIPNINGFDREDQELQDLGLDGLTDEQEREKYAEYITAIEQAGGFINDPSNDNYLSYLDDSYGPEVGILQRFKRFNHPQGNAPLRSNTVGLGNPIPDAEDLNGNRSLERSESFYRYQITLNDNGFGEINTNVANDFITDERTTINPQTDAVEKWYRFQIPIQLDPEQSGNLIQKVGDIEGFRSIQFMRMWMTGFQKPKTFRLAEFELIRNQWRRLEVNGETCDGDNGSTEFVVNEVGLQENGEKIPFNYVLPRGIKQERIYSTFSNLLQDENSLSLNVCNMPDSCRAMISKLTQLDVRQFERLQMFAHAEVKQEFQDGDSLYLFIRMGKDFTNNYYEYELPLAFSDSTIATGSLKLMDFQAYSDEVWRFENKIDFPLTLFTDTKRERNNSNVPPSDIYQLLKGDSSNTRASVKIKGNPSLGLIKGMVIGIRSKSLRANSLCAEVWVNELRMAGFDNRGGIAGIARVDVQLADLGNITASSNYSSIGWGQIDEQLQERQLEELVEYDIATNLELGKFFPDKWGLKIPFYYQFAKSISTPEYDPLELDLTKNQLLENTNLTELQQEDITFRQNDVTTVSTYNFTNVRKERTKDGSPKPWDISNLSASYSFSRTKHRDEIIKNEVTDDQRADMGYSYNAKPLNIEPFKGIKPKILRFIKEFNFNPVPSSFNFNTQMRRYKSEKLYRIPDPSEGFEYAFDDKRFDWTRNYSLSWDLAKSLRFNYDASAVALVDELKQVGVAPTALDRRWEDPMGRDSIMVGPDMRSYADIIDEDPNYADRYRTDNIMDFGRMKQFTQGVSLSYKLPFKFLPGLDWITSQAQYNGDYSWSVASLSSFEVINNERVTLGNIIQNNQRRSLRTTFDFEKLYDKVGYFKTLQGKNRQRGSRTRDKKDEEGGASRSKNKKQREASIIEKVLIRPLLSVRQIKVNYNEDLSTVIPGFTEVPKFLGIAGSNQGLGFAFGLQPDINKENPDNFLRRLEDDITVSRLQNQQVLQNSSQTYEADIELEPWEHLTIDIDYKKRFTTNHSEYFINIDPTGDPSQADYQQLTGRDVGSYDVTYGAIGTLFNGDIDALFKTFEDYRLIVSQRLNPGGPGHAINPGFQEGYGSKHIDVLLPAFLAAYTGQDPNTIELDITEQVRGRGFVPKPNWSLKYDGLSKIPVFKKIFSSFSVRHAYKGNLSVNSFATDLQYDIFGGSFIDPNIATGNFFSRYEIPSLIINEEFKPLIGIDFKTNNDLNFNFEYAKSRRLSLSTDVAKLEEMNATNFVTGLEWTFQDVRIGFLAGGKKTRRRKARNEDDAIDEDEDTTEERDARKPEEGAGVEDVQNRLSIAINVQFRDDVTQTHELDKEVRPESTRGTKSLEIAPVIEYDINKNFTLSFFANYNKTTPKISTSYGRESFEAGIIARFNLN